MYDPLAKAVERLWFNGVTVVAAAGNYAVDGQPSGVLFAPGNDPFVITVGAADIGKSLSTDDDSAAPWSAYGYTPDGFRKPELGAPGRYMIGPVPTGSTLVAQRPEQVRGTGYMELSGTSLAAPVVAGMAAYLLATHPTWTPDQVKGALMLTAKPAGRAAQWSLGVGEAMAQKANYVSNPPNPNAALNQFVVSDPLSGGQKVFDTASWANLATANASWANASWASASWANASWASASWANASWAFGLVGVGLLGERVHGGGLVGVGLLGGVDLRGRRGGRARHRRPDPDARGRADPRAARSGRANRTNDPLARAHRRRRARPALVAGRALSRPGAGSERWSGGFPPGGVSSAA